MVTRQTNSADETFALGEALGRCLAGELTIGLAGPLGAGKTQLVKGMAAGNAAGSAPEVTSPTFTLVHEYPGRLQLYHIDLYRLVKPGELIALGFDEMIRPDSVVVVEWADRMPEVMPEDTLWVEIRPTGATVRLFEFRATGEIARRYLRVAAAAGP